MRRRFRHAVTLCFKPFPKNSLPGSSMGDHLDCSWFVWLPSSPAELSAGSTNSTRREGTEKREFAIISSICQNQHRSLSGSQLSADGGCLSHHAPFAMSFQLQTQLRTSARHVAHASPSQIWHQDRFARRHGVDNFTASAISPGGFWHR